MAVLVVHSAATGSGANSTLALGVTATAGNLLSCYVTASGEASKPSVSDNIGAWTVEATSGETTAATGTVWYAWKKAAGGETEIKATPGGTSTVQAIVYVESSGSAAEAPEHLQFTQKQASSLTHASPEITTANANDLIFCMFGFGASNGEVESWNNGMTNVSTALSRIGGGTFIAVGTLAAKVFTLSLKTTAKVAGGAAVAIKPAGETSFSGTLAQSMAFRQTLVGSKGATGSLAQSMAFRQQTAGFKGALGSVAQRLAFRQVTTAFKGASGAVAQSMAFRQATTAFKSASGAVTQSTAFRQATVGFKSAGAAVKQAFAFVQQLSSVEIFTGAISQAFAFRQTVSGFKSASGTVTQREAFTQKVSGFKTAAGSVAQAFAQRSVVSGFKSVAGRVSQAFAFVQSLATGGGPRPEVQVYATVNRGSALQCSVNPGKPLVAAINHSVVRGLYPTKGLHPKKGLYPSGHTRTVFVTLTPEGVDD